LDLYLLKRNGFDHWLKDMGQLLVVVGSLIISLRRPPPELIPDLFGGIPWCLKRSGISDYRHNSKQKL